MEKIKVLFKRLHPNATVPKYHTPGAAAFDLALIEDIEIPARSLAKVRTGLVIKIPIEHVLILSARSSSPGKKGVTLANGVGIIDSDYCGPNDEIHLTLRNLRDETVRLEKGDRVAQGTILPIFRSEFEEVDELTDQNRGGFGSTGR
ncbi:MAG: dUTP diphosphatase [Patescibacteria group bacterium]